MIKKSKGVIIVRTKKEKIMLKKQIIEKSIIPEKIRVSSSEEKKLNGLNLSLINFLNSKSSKSKVLIFSTYSCKSFFKIVDIEKPVLSLTEGKQPYN